MAPETPEPHIRAARHEDLEAMADCHREAFPDRPMTKLGPTVLCHLYEHYIEAPRGVCLVAMNPNGRLSGLAAGGDRSILRAFRTSCRRQFLPQVLWNAVTQPLVRKALAKALQNKFRRKGTGNVNADPGPDVGNLLSICVSNQARGSKAAPDLLAAFEDGCRERGFTGLQLSVLAENGRARRFYEKSDWVLAESHGSAVRYRYSLGAKT